MSDSAVLPTIHPSASREAGRSAPAVVWCDADGEGRHVFVVFRRRFRLAAVPAQALFALFGETRYRLRVNGEVAAYGPARFVPAAPESDQLDIAPWLRPGDNEITVEVNHRGAPSFEHHPARGGFIAWGSAGEHDLATPGAWECRRATAWDGEAMAISFAQAPVEICDTRELVNCGWQRPVRRDSGPAWGELTPRSIPMLDLRLVGPDRMLGAWSVAGEWRFGYRVPGAASEAGSRRRAPYAMCIHSPTAQQVPIGLFWGPHFLNGRELAPGNHPLLGNRQEAILDLRAGWNLLYGEPEVMLHGWNVLFALPTDRGLGVAASEDLADPQILRHAPSISASELAEHRHAIPATAAELSALAWRTVARGQPAPGPGQVTAWDRPATALPSSPLHRDLVLPSGSHVIVYDFGREFLGHCVLELDAPAGTVIDVTSCERLRSDGLAATYAFHWMFSESDRFIARGGVQTWEGFNPRGGRYLQITVRAAAAAVRISRLAVRETRYPLRLDGAFACSDPLLTWVWRTGAATMLACSEDAYLDCPSRERGLYAGDGLVEMNVTRALTSDYRLARRCLRLFAQAQRPDGQIQDVAPAHKPTTLADYTLLWIMWADDYHRRTGDSSLVEEIWPALVRAIDSPTWNNDDSGLIDVGKLARLHPGVTPLDGSRGLSGLINSLWCVALRGMAGMAGRTGREREAGRLHARADAALAAFRSRLWVEAEGHFTHMVIDGQPTGDGLRTTLYALAYGLATPAQQPSCLAYVEQRFAAMAASGAEPPLGSYDSHHVLAMCERLGRPDLAELWIRHGYAPLHRAGAWTLWEYFAPSASLCHAWSAAPVWWLSDAVLGAGWDAETPQLITVAPCSDSLHWAEGAVPHPLGTVRIAWEIRGGSLLLRVTAPAGTTVECLPRGRLANLVLVASVSQG